MFEERHKETLRETADRWDKLEERIKTAERLRAEVVYPAISELRYAGRRIIDALHISWKDNPTEEDVRNFDGYIAEVKNNCLRAEHDVVDALVLFVHKRLDQMVMQFGLPIVNEYFPDYVRLLTKIRDVDEFIIQSRQERHKRPDIYEDIYENHLPVVMSLYDSMLGAENAIAAVVEQANRDDERRRRWGRIRDVVAVVGLTGTVAGIIIGLMTLT